MHNTKPREENGSEQPHCVGYSEIDKHAIAVYRYHYPEHKNYGDATRIIPEQLPDFDMLVGGFPCQAFSIAGKRKGLGDTRGTLFYDIARIAAVKRPKLLFLENVKGLLSHDKGRTFGLILETFSKLGYILQWQVCNSKNHGVPQNRERVFIIGHLGIGSFRKVFPLGEDGSIPCNKSGADEGRTQAQYSGTLRKNPALKADDTFIKESEQYAQTKRNSQGYRVSGIDGVSTTLASHAGGIGAKTGLYAIPVLTPNRLEKRQKGRRFKEDGDESFTVTKQDIHGVMTGSRIRRLTPTECERLQGFPDNWTSIGLYENDIKPVSNTQRYACCGNAVTTNVITDIAKVLLDLAGGKTQ